MSGLSKRVALDQPEPAAVAGIAEQADILKPDLLAEDGTAGSIEAFFQYCNLIRRQRSCERHMKTKRVEHIRIPPILKITLLLLRQV